MSANKTPNFVFLIFFLAIVLSLYAATLTYGFIFDDSYLIVDNQYVRNLSLKGIFSTDVFHFRPQVAGDRGEYYRPMQLLTYSLEYIIWRMNPFGYRLDNIILHSLNSFLVFLLVYLVFKDRLLALLTGVFFCVIRSQVFLVTFIAGRSNLLELFFVLVSLVSFVYSVSSPKKRYYYFSLISYCAALLTREGALLLPLYIIVCSLFLKPDREKSVGRFIPYLVISLAYIMLRGMFMPSGRFGISEFFSSGAIINFIFNSQDYFWQLIMPLGLKANWLDNNPVLGKAPYYLFLAVFAYSLFRFIAKRKRVALFGVAMYAVGILPVLKLGDTISYYGSVLSEHYVYNASIGFCVLLAGAILALHARFPRFSKAALVLACLYFCGLTITDTYHYKNEIAFYRYVLSVDPDSAIARLNLGNAYYMKKEYALAMDEAEKVLRLEPDSWDAYLLLANISMKKGEPGKAEKLYHKALLFNPRSDIALNNLGLIYGERGKYPEALELFRKALMLNPESPDIMVNMAGIFVKKGEYDKALALCEKALDMDRHFLGAYNMLSLIYGAAGEHSRSVELSQKAIRIDPDSAEAYTNLCGAYGNQGRMDKALDSCKRALAIDPDSALAHANISAAYYYLKEYGLAVRHCDEAVRLGHKPDERFLKLLEPYRSRKIP